MCISGSDCGLSHRMNSSSTTLNSSSTAMPCGYHYDIDPLPIQSFLLFPLPYLFSGPAPVVQLGDLCLRRRHLQFEHRRPGQQERGPHRTHWRPAPLAVPRRRSPPHQRPAGMNGLCCRRSFCILPSTAVVNGLTVHTSRVISRTNYHHVLLVPTTIMSTTTVNRTASTTTTAATASFRTACCTLPLALCQYVPGACPIMRRTPKFICHGIKWNAPSLHTCAHMSIPLLSSSALDRSHLGTRLLTSCSCRCSSVTSRGEDTEMACYDCLSQAIPGNDDGSFCTT